MRQIMHYDAEFRREEAASAVALTRSTDGGSDRVAQRIKFDPPLLGQAGGRWARGARSKQRHSPIAPT